jgi:hypothetical protein
MKSRISIPKASGGRAGFSRERGRGLQQQRKGGDTECQDCFGLEIRGFQGD